MYYVQWWRHHFNSRTAWDKFAGGVSEHFLTDTMLKVHVCEPFTFMGPFTCVGPFRFRVALIHQLYRAFHYHMVPFYTRETSWSGTSGACVGST